MNATFVTIVPLASLMALSPSAHGQADLAGRQPGKVPAPVKSARAMHVKFTQPSFTFVRIQYSSNRQGPSASSWNTDYPDADLNFSARFEKETGIRCEREGKVMTLTDPELSKHPFIYIAEGGRVQLSDAEAVGLRRYLLGGGFLMVDDFWGEKEWSSLQAQLKRALPEREAFELSLDHPLFHCWFDIYEKPQVPNVALGIRSQFTGVTWEREDGRAAHYRGLLDDQGRLMAVLCHNTDLGDGWERESEHEYYSREFSLKRAYPMGINIAVYALTQSAANYLVPLIVVDDVPLLDVIRNLARQASLNVIFDPRVPGSDTGPGRSIPAASVSRRWTNTTAQAALDAVLADHKLAMVINPVTTVARIAPAGLGVQPVPASRLGTDTGLAMPSLVLESIPLTEAITRLATEVGLKVSFGPGLTGRASRDHGDGLRLRWERMTARQALVALLDNYGLVMSEDPATSTARITLGDDSPLKKGR